MNDGSIISIPDSDTSVHTVIDNGEETSKSGYQSPSKQQFYACALFVNHWVDGTIKDGSDLRTAKKTYVDGLKEKPSESSTIIFESKIDNSRKENTVDCSMSPLVKMQRRKTVLHNLQKATATGRRKTICIDALNAPTKKSKPHNIVRSAAKNTSSVGNGYTEENQKTSPSSHNNNVVRSEGNRQTEKSLHTSNKKENTKDPPASKDNKNQHSSATSLRRTLLPESSLHRGESNSSHQLLFASPSNCKISSPHRHSSTSHRSVSSSKRTESQRQSSSSDGSAHKRRSSKDRHPNHHEKKRRRISENKTKSHSNERMPKTSSHEKALNGTNEKMLLIEKDHVLENEHTDDSSSLLIPLRYSDVSPTNPNVIVRNEMPSKKPPLLSASIKMAKNLSRSKTTKVSDKTVVTEATNHAKNSRCEEAVTKRKSSKKSAVKSQSHDEPKFDPSMNPTVLLHRLNLKRILSNDKLELSVSGKKYMVHNDVNGSFKIETKKKKKDSRPSQKVRNHQICETKDKFKNVVSKKPVETRNFSQQTKSVSKQDIGIQKNDKEAAQMTKKHNDSIALFTQSVKEYDTAVCEQQHTINLLKETIKEQKDNMSERENKIAERDRMITERDLKIAERERMIAERDTKIAERDSKVKELEEQIKLQESKIKYMAIQVNTLKRSELSLSNLLKEQADKEHQSALTVSPSVTKVLQNGVNPIRVKSIDQLRDNSVNSHLATSQRFYTHAQSEANAVATSIRSANAIQTGNVLGWSVNTTSNSSTQPLQQQSCLQDAQYSQNIAPSVQYMCLYNIQQPASATNSNSTIATPHQNLPRIIQKSTRPIEIRPKTSNAPPNNPIILNPGYYQTVSMQERSLVPSQLRSRAKSCFYGSPSAVDRRFNTK